MQLILLQTDMLLLAASEKHVLTVSSATFKKQREARGLKYSCQLHQSPQQKLCLNIKVAQASNSSVQQHFQRMCDRRTYIIYVGLQCAAVQSERRTHRDHLSLFPDKTAGDNPISCRCRLERPGWRTICSLSKDDPVKLVTLWISCRLLAPLPCLSSP